jgi:hypothetical protein
MKQLIFSVDGNFFCELAQVLKVADSDTLINIICLFVTAALFGVFCGCDPLLLLSLSLLY